MPTLFQYRQKAFRTLQPPPPPLRTMLTLFGPATYLRNSVQIPVTGISAACEILRICIVKFNLTHFSASRQDKRVL